jgi:glycosyltransferase involved in cell wall biosynthesis
VLVSPGDETALAEALAQLTADPGLRRRFGAAGRRLVEQGLDDCAIGSAMQTVYHDLLMEYQSF